MYITTALTQISCPPQEKSDQGQTWLSDQSTHTKVIITNCEGNQGLRTFSYLESGVNVDTVRSPMDSFVEVSEYSHLFIIHLNSIKYL